MVRSVSRMSFNSCPRAEGNFEWQDENPSAEVSIRALARRATVEPDVVELRERKFQFVPSRGGQQQIYTKIVDLFVHLCCMTDHVPVNFVRHL